MEYKFSEYLTIDDGFSFEDLLPSFQYLTIDGIHLGMSLPTSPQPFVVPKMYDEGVRIKIQGTWYDVVPISKLVRTKSEDGYFRAIYIWINYDSGEYYIGKVNAAKRKKLLSYTGSGVLFKPKFEKHKDRFVRYYLCHCKTAKETEEMEARIVNQELLKDPFCLNRIQGGGKGRRTDYGAERKKKQSEYMKTHPERYKAMVEAASLFTLADIQRRGASIKKTMSDEKYKKMTSERIKKWKAEHPEEYALARAKNKAALVNPETRAKRLESRKKYKEEHPEEYAEWEKKRKASVSRPDVRAKMSKSQEEWMKNNPEKYKERLAKMHKAQREKAAKPVEMYDLRTGDSIKTFDCIKDAANWLLSEGLTTGKNPSSTIVAICKGRQEKGHGTKKSYLGYGWRYR